MKTTVNLIPRQTLQPTDSVVASFAVPDNVDVVVALHTRTGTVAPTTPLSVRVEQSFDEVPDIWFEAGRYNSAVQPNESLNKVIQPNRLARHIRVTALGHKAAAVEVAALVVAG